MKKVETLLVWFGGKAKATSEVAEDFPFGSNDPNILFDNSIAALLTVRRSSVAPILDPLVISNDKIRFYSVLSRVFSLSIHLTHILSVPLSRSLSIPHHHAIRSKLHTILALY